MPIMWEFIYVDRHMHMNLIYTYVLCTKEYTYTQEDGMEKCVLK